MSKHPEQELEKTPAILINVNDTAVHNICYERCENNKSICLETSNLSSVGRFLTLSTTVKSVCPNKNVALGIKVYETTNGNKVIKGHKMYSFQHNENGCRDITLSNIHFVLPEEIAETCDKSNICSRRTFDIETTSHYVDLSEV